MREIKFRAWDFSGNVMFYNVDLIDGVWAEHGLKLESAVGTSKTLMQFTNKKDKNGKDIYEGDIVVGGLNKKKEVVEFDSKIASFWPLHLISWHHELEVVGNLYENPESLPAYKSN